MAWQSAIGRGCVHESPLDVHLASTTRAHLRPSAAYADPSPASTVGKLRKAVVRRYASSQRGSVTAPRVGGPARLYKWPHSCVMVAARPLARRNPHGFWRRSHERPRRMNAVDLPRAVDTAALA